MRKAFLTQRKASLIRRCRAAFSRRAGEGTAFSVRMSWAHLSRSRERSTRVARWVRGSARLSLSGAVAALSPL